LEIERQNIQQINQKNLLRDKNLLIVFSITLMAVLGVSSIAPAFPRIVGTLGITYESVGLLISVFTLPSVILAPILGIFADRVGRKKILIPALFLFGIAGFLCVFMRDFTQLLILRFLQGIGAASLGTLNLTVIGDLYSDKQMTKAMGYNGAITSIGTATFPIIGGFLANINWAFPFILPISAIPIGFLALFLLKNPEPKKQHEIRKYLVSTIKNMQNRQTLALFITSFIIFILVYGAILTYFPILIDKMYNIPPFIINVSSFDIGLIISSLSIAAAVISGLLGKLTKYYGEKTYVKISFILYGVALLIIPFIPKLILYIIPLILFGIAQGINVPSTQALIADSSSIEQRAIFMSVNGMFIYLGQTVGPLLLGIIFGFWGLSALFIVGFILSIGMFALLSILFK